MINFSDFNNIFQQVNDAQLTSMLDNLCEKVTERVQAERDANAYAYKTQLNGSWRVVIEGSSHNELYAITGAQGDYGFIRVFVQ